MRWTTAAIDGERDVFASRADAVRAVVFSELRVDETLVASLQGDVAAIQA